MSRWTGVRGSPAASAGATAGAAGPVCFASKAGQLSGNHFLTIVKGKENLQALGKMTLWQGAQDILFELA